MKNVEIKLSQQLVYCHNGKIFHNSIIDDCKGAFKTPVHTLCSLKQGSSKVIVDWNEQVNQGRLGTTYGQIVGLIVTLLFLASHVDSILSITKQFVLLNMVKIMISKI